MNKKIIVLLVGFILFTIALLGCINNQETDTQSTDNDTDLSSDKDRIVGMWNTSNPIQWYIKPSFVFYENESFDVSGVGGTYVLKNDTLELHWNDEYNTVYTYSYEFLDNNTLQLVYIDTGDEGIYKRQ